MSARAPAPDPASGPVPGRMLRVVGPGEPVSRPGLYDLEDFLPYRLNRISEELSLGFARVYKARHGMTRPEWRVLAVIGTRGSVTAREICTDSTMHKTKVSRAISALEKRRWLTRSAHEHDGRSERVELTRTGWRAFEELMVLAERYSAEVEARLGAALAPGFLSGLGGLEAEFGVSGPIRDESETG